MKTLFADTYFFLAIVNPRDAGHKKTMAYANTARVNIVYTDWIVTELADALCTVPNRPLFARCSAILQGKTLHRVPFDDALFRRGLDLFAARPDKEWSLTDCVSFVVMAERGIVEALTADHHLEQAGFVALLK